MSPRGRGTAAGSPPDAAAATPAEALAPGATGDSDLASGPTLVVEDLRTSFATDRGELKAVDGVSFVLHRGRTLGVVGESGSGKSATARSIMNLLPPGSSTSSGRVLLDGRDVRRLTRKQQRHVWGVEAAMVFQNPMTSLNPVMQVGRQIAEGLRYHRRLGRTEARRRARELLEQVGIADPERRLREYPHQLSGGMRQRVAIATALACEPKLLVADEPTTALDVTVQKQILDLLDRLRRRHRMAMILITHDLSVVAGRADDVVVMYAGRIAEQAPTVQLFTAMRHPYTKALFDSVPKVTNPSHTRLRIIQGRPPDPTALPPGCAFAPRCTHAQPRCLTEAPTLTGPGPTGAVSGHDLPAEPHAEPAGRTTGFGDHGERPLHRSEPRAEQFGEPTATSGIIGTPHRYACFYPTGTPEGEAALASNHRAGRTAAGLVLTNGTPVIVGSAS